MQLLELGKDQFYLLRQGFFFREPTGTRAASGLFLSWMQQNLGYYHLKHLGEPNYFKQKLLQGESSITLSSNAVLNS